TKLEVRTARSKHCRHGKKCEADGTLNFVEAQIRQTDGRFTDLWIEHAATLRAHLALHLEDIGKVCCELQAHRNIDYPVVKVRNPHAFVHALVPDKSATLYVNDTFRDGHLAGRH